MLRLSSNITLFLKFFIPVFWTTILLGLTVVTWTEPTEYFGGASMTTLRYGSLFVLLTTVGIFYLALWPLKRVETDGEYLYVSNYFKTARYHLGRDVERFEDSRFLFLLLATVELRGRGAFGKRCRFVASRQQYREFVVAFNQQRRLSESLVDDVVE